MSVLDPMGLTLKYCNTNQIEVICVERQNNQHFCYYFDLEAKRFLPLKCAQCQPIVTERHLLPLYSEWNDKIKDHVIHVNNLLTAKIEQYIYCRGTGGFIEVNISEFNNSIPVSTMSSEICRYPKTNDYQEVIIKSSHKNRNIRKWKYSEKDKKFYELGQVYVRTLDIQELEKGKKRVFPEGIDEYKFDNCPHKKMNYVEFVFKNQTLIYYWDQLLRKFKKFKCSKCFRTFPEEHFSLFCAQHYPPTNEVIFTLVNIIHCHIQNFIFNPKTCGFEQVGYGELSAELADPDTTCVELVDESGGVFFITVDAEFQLHKYRKHPSGHVQSLPSVPVKMLKIFPEEEEEKAEPKEDSTSTVVNEAQKEADTPKMQEVTEESKEEPVSSENSTIVIIDQQAPREDQDAPASPVTEMNPADTAWLAAQLKNLFGRDVPVSQQNNK